MPRKKSLRPQPGRSGSSSAGKTASRAHSAANSDAGRLSLYAFCTLSVFWVYTNLIFGVLLLLQVRGLFHCRLASSNTDERIDPQLSYISSSLQAYIHTLMFSASGRFVAGAAKPKPSGMCRLDASTLKLAKVLDILAGVLDLSISFRPRGPSHDNPR